MVARLKIAVRTMVWVVKRLFRYTTDEDIFLEKAVCVIIKR